MALEIQGKTALITGGGSGIGLALTKRLLKGGCNVAIADLTLTPDAEEVVKQSSSGKVQAKLVKADVTKWDQLQNAFDFAIKEFGRLDIVVPGAGVFEPEWSNFWYFNKGRDTNASSSYATIDLNVTHPIRATQLAIDYFLRQKLGGGVVVLISSVAAQMALLPTPLYSASKHAISGFTRSLGHLEEGLNIRVNGIAPGVVKTPIWTPDKEVWVDDKVDVWLTPDQIAVVIIDLITNQEHVGGTILEVGADLIRPVQELNDPGPSGRGHTVANIANAFVNVYGLIGKFFGK